MPDGTRSSAANIFSMLSLLIINIAATTRVHRTGKDVCIYQHTNMYKINVSRQVCVIQSVLSNTMTKNIYLHINKHYLWLFILCVIFIILCPHLLHIIAANQWCPYHNMAYHYVDGLVQDCSNSSANALELLQSCTKPSMWYYKIMLDNDKDKI